MDSVCYRYITFTLWLLVSGGSLSAQEKECQGQYSLAEDFYSSGDFDEALRMLEQYQSCTGIKNSAYYKLSARLAVATDRRADAKRYLALYIQSKTSNYLSDEDPQVLKDLFFEVQDSLSARLITSLSKRAEDIDLAAATVIVIREDEIKRRGYLDLTDLLADQPGFDISKLYASTYANVYQRGFRQENTERTLLMIDGIEENDVWSNIAYISRQYPLSNIRAVEIVYGPASTVYGARAFAGAINIITKNPGQLTKRASRKPGSFHVGADARLLAGSYNTKSADVSIGGTGKDLSFLFTARTFGTDGRDLSGTPFYDYNVADIDHLGYDVTKLAALRYTDNPATTQNELDAVVTGLGLTPGSKYYDYFTGYGTGTLSANPDSLDALLAMARETDKQRYLTRINGAPVGYSNAANNYYFGGKVKMGDFEAGFRTWKSQEGFNYYQDLFAAGTDNGSKWTPRNTTFYTIFDKQFRRISLSNTSSYVIHGLDPGSQFVSYNSFYGLLTANPYTNPTLLNIVFPDSLIDGRRQGWQNTYFFYSARQFRNDMKVNYKWNRISLLGGVDLRNSQLQGDYLQYRSYAGGDPEDQENVHLAEELGTVAFQDKGGNQYNTIDAGVYTQLTYTALDSVLYLTAGGRFDHNRIRNSGGFGNIFNPKFALVYTVKGAIIKAIYSRGIQNPSQFTKFSTGASRNANPTLQTEKIQNFELVVQNGLSRTFHWDVSAFYSVINDAVASAVDPADPNKAMNQNVGTYQISGAQANLHFVPKKGPFSYQLNTTYTHARQTKIENVAGFSALTIADVAPLKTNLAVNYHQVFRANSFNINLRANFVGDKPVGPSTTVPLNMGFDDSEKIPGYGVMFLTFLYSHSKFEYATLRFTINNLLNARYYSPGPRTANGNYNGSYNGFVPWVPQQTRNFLVTLSLKL